MSTEPAQIGLGEIASVVTIVAGITGAVALWATSRALALSSLGAMIAGIAFIAYRHKTRYFREIKSGIRCMLEHFREQKYEPDIIIALTRTSAVIAGMLSVNLAVEQVLVISRKAYFNEQGLVQRREFEIGSGISLKKEEFAGKRILIAFISIETGTTLRDGLAFLEKQGLDEKVKVATVYITPGAKLLYPDAFYVYETSRDITKGLPWIFGKYRRV